MPINPDFAVGHFSEISVKNGLYSGDKRQQKTANDFQLNVR
jgi:hypothetical protein